MNALAKLWSAFTGLTNNVNALSSSIAEINAGLRARVGLDADAEPEAVETGGKRRIGVKP